MAAATDVINIKINGERKRALQAVAAANGKSLSEFMIWASFAEARALAKLGPREDPFVVEMRRAAAAMPKAELSEAELQSVIVSRKARSKGGKGLGVAEAIKVINQV